MPDYFVKTYDDRNLVIEADKFESLADRTYSFIKDNKVVANVPQGNIFAVVEEKAYKADFYADDEDLDDPDEDNTADTCLECQASELVDTDAFFDGVISVLDAYFGHDADTDRTQPTEPAPTPQIEHRKYREGRASGWGPVIEGQFIPWGSKEDAEAHLPAMLEFGASPYYTIPVEETELIPENTH